MSCATGYHLGGWGAQFLCSASGSFVGTLPSCKGNPCPSPKRGAPVFFSFFRRRQRRFKGRFQETGLGRVGDGPVWSRCGSSSPLRFSGPLLLAEWAVWADCSDLTRGFAALIPMKFPFKQNRCFCFVKQICKWVCLKRYGRLRHDSPNSPLAPRLLSRPWRMPAPTKQFWWVGGLILGLGFEEVWG